jgi:uncharacterized membrane protein
MGAPRAELAPVTFAEVRGVIGQRCVPCHNEQLAQKGLALDSAQAIVQHAPAIHQQVVLQRTMPMNNATRMADAERALIARWFAAGAAAK